MKVFILIDSFKGSLSSLQAGCAAAEGIRRVFPEAEVQISPIADGGEGTVEALVSGLHGQMQQVQATDPLGRPICCAYGIVAERTAVIEMSCAAGLPLLTPEERNPLRTTTYGVGEVILDAISRGCRQFLIGIGGSATNDGGAGMLQALGFDLLDAAGLPIARGAEGLASLASISSEHAHPALADCMFQIACDVTNPLCGSNGCSAIYGPQKGADAAAIERMDRWLARYAVLAKKIFPDADPDAPGAGAAGGMGFAFRSFLRGSLVGGIDLVLTQLAVEAQIQEADVVITGEGRLDAQTAMGKAPIGIARIAKKYHKPVIALCGCAASDARGCNDAGIDAYFPIVQGACSLEEAMKPQTACANLADTAEQVFRLLRTASTI